MCRAYEDDVMRGTFLRRENWSRVGRHLHLVCVSATGFFCFGVLTCATQRQAEQLQRKRREFDRETAILHLIDGQCRGHLHNHE